MDVHWKEHRMRISLKHRRLFRLALGLVLIWLGLCSSGPALAATVLKDDDVVAICGDSITEQRLYSVFVESYLLACKPADHLRVLELGWPAETATLFQPRIGSDLLPFHPTVVTLLYGMSDGAYAAVTPQSSSTFRNSMKTVLDALKAGGVRAVVVGSPTCVDTYTYNLAKRAGGDASAYNQTLAALGEISRSLAKENHAHFADVHALMDDAMGKAKARYGEKFAVGGPEGVLPGAAGHIVIAYAFLKSLGCEGNLGGISLDMLSRDRNRAFGGHRILSADNGAVQIESRRMPFCFFGNPESAAADMSMSGIIPFNQELNRMTLEVHNAGEGKLRVTWNDKVKDFSSDMLAKGINLAAEFPDNPFSEAFARVEKAVRAQQEFEAHMVKVILHHLPAERDLLPDQAALFDQLTAAAMKQDRALADAAQAEADKPIQHTLRIEPVP